MCNIYVYAAMAFMSAAGAYKGAQSKADEFDAEADSYEYQAAAYDEKERLALKESELSEVQAMDTLKIGSVERRKVKLSGRQVVAAQKVGYAGSGVRVDTGVAQDVIEETERGAEGDAMVLRSNYAKESFGYRLNAWKKRGEARTFRISAVNARKSARDSRRGASKTRNAGLLGALASGLGSAANYRG